MPKNLRIEIPDEVAFWLRRRAAEEHISVSKLLSNMLERAMRSSAAYWRAFEGWKSRRPFGGVDAAQRMSRDEVHERR